MSASAWNDTEAPVWVIIHSLSSNALGEERVLLALVATAGDMWPEQTGSSERGEFLGAGSVWLRGLRFREGIAGSFRRTRPSAESLRGAEYAESDGETTVMKGVHDTGRAAEALEGRG